MNTIAKHGGLKWEAESDIAGPYHLTSNFMIFASFGTRSLAVGRPGSIWQIEAFKTSQAAFNAIRLCTDATRTAADLRRYAKIATAAARAEYKKWSPTLNHGGRSEDPVNFQKAVDRRVAAKLGASVAAS